MINNKVLVLLPDGVGLRNFAYSNFYKTGSEQGLEIHFWNNTPFDLATMGINEIKIPQAKSHPLTDIYKNVRKQIELNLNKKRNRDNVYDSYRFRYSYKDFPAALKSTMIRVLTALYSSPRGLKKIRKKIQTEERKTLYFHQCLETLKIQKPALVFCTNQRPLSAIAPILAARELGIPTATFIFSWDNLPKATMVIETDYYFVWSDLMQQQLLSYYPYIDKEQVFVTGTPQFEPHSDPDLLVSRAEFYAEYQLDLQKRYICYSGDDVTTSPNDPKYLEDVAAAVRHLNSAGNYNLGIIFRRCPVDFTDRFDQVLAANRDLIKIVSPKWEKVHDRWNAILPLADDVALQMNTIRHTEMVINLGSSMVFDYVSFGKPCAYMNYDYEVQNPIRKNWSVAKTYNFVHFRSMPDNAVIWLSDPATIAAKIEAALIDSSDTVTAAKKWFKTINLQPTEKASERMYEGFRKIISQHKSTSV